MGISLGESISVMTIFNYDLVAWPPPPRVCFVSEGGAKKELLTELLLIIMWNMEQKAPHYIPTGQGQSL